MSFIFVNRAFVFVNRAKGILPCFIKDHDAQARSRSHRMMLELALKKAVSGYE